MDKKITKFVFPNKLVLIHNESGPLPIVEIKLFIDVGSINELPDKNGITSLLQTMLLKGTKNRTAEQIAMDIESMGGSIATDSDEDFSVISVSVTSDNFDKAMDILSDIFLNPVFPEKEIEKEKMTTLAAIKARQDSIFNVANDLLMKKLYKEHPYSMLSIGSSETVSGLTREDLTLWYKKYYGTPNAVLVIVGNVNLETAKNRADRYFSSMPAVQSSRYAFREPEISGTEPYTLKEHFEQAYVMYGYLAPRADNPDYPALKVLNSYLSMGMSSVLFQELREKSGLCYETSSFYPSRKDTSRFVIYIGLDRANIALSKEKIDSIINGLKKQQISEKELKEIKNNIKGTYLLDHQTINRQSWFLGWWEIIAKDYRYDGKYLKDLMKVSSKDVLNAANKYFQDNYVIVEILPDKNSK